MHGVCSFRQMTGSPLALFLLVSQRTDLSCTAIYISFTLELGEWGSHLELALAWLCVFLLSPCIASGSLMLGLLLLRGWHSSFGKSCPSLEASVSYTACHLDSWISRFIFLSGIQHLKMLSPEKIKMYFQDSFFFFLFWDNVPQIPGWPHTHRVVQDDLALLWFPEVLGLITGPVYVVPGVKPGLWGMLDTMSMCRAMKTCCVLSFCVNSSEIISISQVDMPHGTEV